MEVLIVVRYAHTTPGISSTHAPFLDVQLFLRIPTRVLVAALTCLLACECLGDEYLAFIPSALHQFL